VRRWIASPAWSRAVARSALAEVLSSSATSSSALALCSGVGSTLGLGADRGGACGIWIFGLAATSPWIQDRISARREMARIIAGGCGTAARDGK
jgi:hypothetical protein